MSTLSNAVLNSARAEHDLSNGSTSKIATANLHTVSLALLEDHNAGEIDRLLAACTTHGFFYLDFARSKAPSLPQDKEAIFTLMKDYFEQPLETKILDARGTPTRGFVRKGTFSGVDKDAQEESFEHLAIGRDELLKDFDKTLPALYQPSAELIKSYFQKCEHTVGVLLRCLSDALHLEGSQRLENGHSDTKPSDTILAMLSYPGGTTTHQKHTDLGSLTVLFSNDWGLQVVSREGGDWELVEPRAEQAIINVGDGLRFQSGKQLYSSLHRVVRGGVGHVHHRYSLAYLLRPDYDLEFEDAEGVRVTMREFGARKYDSYAASHEEQRKDQTLTGGMEQVFRVTA